MTNEPLHTDIEKKLDNQEYHKKLTLAESTAWGVISAGSGFRQLEEIFSHLGIKCMSNSTFIKLEQNIGEVS